MAYRNKVMTVYVLGLMMSVIDGTMVNVALPTLASEFGVPTTDIEWIAIGYLLSFAAVIPAAGWLGDRFGTKRVFIVALAIFVAMSLLCGVAQSLDQLVFFRILQPLRRTRELLAGYVREKFTRTWEGRCHRQKSSAQDGMIRVCPVSM